MNKIIVVGYARTRSKRLPNKVLFDLGEKPAFVQVIERITDVVKADRVFVACTIEAADDPIELLAKQHGIECFRGAQSIQQRCLLMGERLGLKDDDWWIGVHCDSVLSMAEYLPWAMEEAEKHDCQAIYATMPKGTLIESFWISCVPNRWWIIRTEWATAHRVDAEEQYSGTLEGFKFGVRKYLIVHWPSEYLVPWHWGPMILDHPVQAGVIKEVYRQLYKGSPIDILDVYRLFQREPRLAQMIPLTLPHAANHALPGQEQDPYIESIKQNAEYVELTWGGGKSVDKTVPYSGKYENKLRGGKRV